jgi:hypothetical protein
MPLTRRSVISPTAQASTLTRRQIGVFAADHQVVEKATRTTRDRRAEED